MHLIESDLWRLLLRSSLHGPTKCLLYKGTTSQTGYGQILVGGKLKAAHRVMWEATRGPIPTGLFVCHRCDVRNCINPEHLWLGTNADNMADKREKKRSWYPRGEIHPHAKLTDAQAGAIIKDKRLHRLIAADYKVSTATISLIRSGKIWRHIKRK